MAVHPAPVGTVLAPVPQVLPAPPPAPPAATWPPHAPQLVPNVYYQAVPTPAFAPQGPATHLPAYQSNFNVPQQVQFLQVPQTFQVASPAVSTGQVFSAPGVSGLPLPLSASPPLAVAGGIQGVQVVQAMPGAIMTGATFGSAGHTGASCEGFGFSKEQCARIIELQQQYQAAGDHESQALVAHYAAAGVDLSEFLEVAAATHRPPLVHDPNRRFKGSVRSWNPDGGFGFIVCAESRAIYNKVRIMAWVFGAS
ncbi:unnamed protein product [Durusdinium trenchii]|uniref:CSD domain-containing protein n=2 Tax=Durusdinium trenchii TaxID=1381693 RepID=A0ABP0LWD4_9DINO